MKQGFYLSTNTTTNFPVVSAHISTKDLLEVKHLSPPLTQNKHRALMLFISLCCLLFVWDWGNPRLFIMLENADVMCLYVLIFWPDARHLASGTLFAQRGACEMYRNENILHPQCDRVF